MHREEVSLICPPPQHELKVFLLVFCFICTPGHLKNDKNFASANRRTAVTTQRDNGFSFFFFMFYYYFYITAAVARVNNYYDNGRGSFKMNRYCFSTFPEPLII